MIEITEPSILIRITKLFRDEMTENELYEATRGVWKVGERRKKALFAFSIAKNTIQEVYTIDTWHPAGSTIYKTRKSQDINIKNRWEFTGKIASSTIRKKYIGQSVLHYFPKGSSNPINYTNCT